MRTTPLPGQRSDYSPTPDYNPQQYVCVAVLRNDKGEEVALKNSEVTFDARGLATFSGLMVMKGTWGKTVQLTFEARWGGAKRLAGMIPVNYSLDVFLLYYRWKQLATASHAGRLRDSCTSTYVLHQRQKDIKFGLDSN